MAQPGYPNQQGLVQNTQAYNTASNGQFSTGLCSWCAEPGGCSLCFCSACCCCVQYGRNVEKLGPQATCGGNCCGGGWLYCLMASLGLQCIPQLITRGEVRRAYGLQPAGCADFMTAWCCGTCDLCQVSREIDIRRGSPGANFGTTYPTTTAVPQTQTMTTQKY